MMSDAPVDAEIDDTVREHFIKIGEVLSHYRSGKLPKGFKAIPSFPNWQQVSSLAFHSLLKPSTFNLLKY